MVVRPDAPPGGGLQVLDVAARTDAATTDHMTWEVTDLGFRMGLSPEVPAVLGRHVGDAVATVLDRNGLSRDDIDAWAVHPGGPRILTTVAEALDLPTGALDASHEVLAEYGNCSSATILLVLDALRRAGRPRPGRVAAALAFGPGLTLYTMLLRAT